MGREKKRGVDLLNPTRGNFSEPFLGQKKKNLPERKKEGV